MGILKKRLSKVGRKIKDACLVWFKLRYHYGWHYKHDKIRDNWILFESFHGKNVSDSPLYMCREFLEDPRSKDFRIFFSTDHKREHAKLVKSLGLPVELVSIKSYKYMKCLARCKYLVNNSSFPSYFIRRPEQHYIQTWHGTPLKTLGKRMRMGIESMYNVQHNFLQSSILTYPNEYMREIMMRDYNLERLYTGKVAMLGYPRNTVFFDERRAQEIRAQYGLDDMEVFAYMPTWRGASNHDVDVEGYQEQVLHYFDYLDGVLGPKQRIYVNFHSMVAAQMGELNYEHIKSFPADADNYEFLNACDALITDYSSVFFDYSLTRKPVILFVYDQEEYLRERGMYLDLDELPFPKVREVEELGRLLADGAYKDIVYEGGDYEREYLSHDSAENSRRALRLLFEGEASGVELIDYAKNGERSWRVVEASKQNSVLDIKTICQSIDPERDICVFLRSKFNRDKSAYLHDNHRDEFNFLFINKAVACTSLEAIAAKHSQKTSELLEERERRRCLPGLRVEGPVERDVYLGEVGTTVSFVEEPEVTVQPSVQKGKLVIKLANGGSDERYEFRDLVLVQGRRVMWSRPLEPGELERGRISENFEGLYRTDELKKGRRIRVCLDAIDRATGKLVPLSLSVRNAPKTCDDDIIPSYLPPITRKIASLKPRERAACEQFFTKHQEDDGNPAFIPYANARGNLAFLIDFENTYLTRIKFARMRSIRARTGSVRLKTRMRKGDFILEDVRLRLRSTVDPVEFSLPFTARLKGDWIYLDIEFDPQEYPLQEIYWDLFIVISHDGVLGRVATTITYRQLLGLCMRNVESRVGQGDLLFPFATRNRHIAFTYRPHYPDLDTMKTRFKEFAALFVFAVGHPYWKRKRIWLVYEKFCHLAQDNGYYFFEYCMSEDGPREKDHVFYVIDKSQPDYENVRAYDDHVIQHMSFKHMLYCLAANIYIASDSRSHLYVWRPKPSAIAYLIRRRKIFFLQHGVTALKRVDNLFGKKGSSPMTYFLTTSENEQKIVVGNFGYNLQHAPILGFSRWDALRDLSSKEEPAILLMPTWRPWLEEQDAETFVASDYFRAYSSFIQSPKLAKLLERHNARLRFYIHPKLADQLGNFSAENPRVQLIPQGSEPLNRVMMECNAIITDYSSVCWDMLYMDKPVVYYQFDQELYEHATGSYVDLDHDLPGDVCKTEDELMAALERCAERGFTMTPEQVEIATGWFSRKDTKNRERTYNFLANEGY